MTLEEQAAGGLAGKARGELCRPQLGVSCLVRDSSQAASA